MMFKTRSYNTTSGSSMNESSFAASSSCARLILDTAIAVSIFAILAVCSFCIDKNTGMISISWVLTNNRIYGQIATLKIKQIESYNLNKITYYKLYQMTKKKTTYLTLMLKTSTDTVKFTVNEEFYNSFVNAVNATISITE